MKETELLTVRDIAVLFRVDPTTVRRWITAGALPAVCLPHKGKRTVYRIKKGDVESVLNNTGIPLAV